MSTVNNNKQLFINDQYLTIKKIGQGGFGTVWKAYDFSLRNFVTIKELLKDFTEPKYIEMFYKEALIAKNIIHDNIVRVQHFWKGTNDSYYIVMDYVSGDDLENILSKCKEINIRLPWEIAVHITGNILKAIDFANRGAKDPITGRPFGIVYRDLSPGNVLISFEGNIKLSDFGIAKTADDISCRIKRRIVTGKYAYMSPEQIECDPEIDHRSDIFSVGIVLYEMLSGKPLFKGTNEEIKAQVLETKFDSKLLNNLNLSDDLVEIVGKALEKKKGNRYEKALEMFRDMRRLSKLKETEELTLELSSFLTKIMPERYNSEKESIKFVKQLNIQDIKSDINIEKFFCKDFIMGELHREEQEDFEKIKEISESEDKEINLSYEPEFETKAEEKGKTVFEEVGDWFINKFITYKKMIIRGIIAFFVALIIFGVADTFFQITTFGKYVFSYLYPPDIIITTVPSGAKVSMRTREGKIIVSDQDSTLPVKLRKILPRTYIITAEKKGFKPTERVIKIEEPTKSAKKKKLQKIEMFFDFMLRVRSDIEGADIFIDGNKVGVSTWTGTITSGEHTVKLTAPGFEDLGSVAKETKEGQCSIDFTKAALPEIFANADPKFWKYEMTSIGEDTVFVLSGSMVKKVTINTVPQRMILHIKNESKDRGKTPIVVALKSGEYLLRFMDPEGKYAEATATLLVGKGSSESMRIFLRRWVTVKIKTKGLSNEPFATNVIIKGSKVDIKGEVSTTKPFRIALYPGTYKFLFEGNAEYDSFETKEIDINDESTIVAEMQYKKVMVRIVVKDSDARDPIPDASIWTKDKLLGQTDKDGVWEGLVEYGMSTLGIVATNYLGTTIVEEIKPNEKKVIEVYLVPDTKIPVSAIPEPNKIAELKNSLEEVSATVGNAVGATVGITTGKNVPEAISKNVVTGVSKSTETAKSGQKEITIYCSNCGTSYNITPGKKLRFCTNCGKPLRY
ncbi:MAG: protein kinase [Elusimicrobia bacterium]|nr:protein kinase [Elusimicrobiota bacterium]